MAYTEIAGEIAVALEGFTAEGGNIIDEAMGEYIAEGSIVLGPEIEDEEGTIFFETESGQQYKITVEPVIR